MNPTGDPLRLTARLLAIAAHADPINSPIRDEEARQALDAAGRGNIGEAEVIIEEAMVRAWAVNPRCMWTVAVLAHRAGVLGALIDYAHTAQRLTEEQP